VGQQVRIGGTGDGDFEFVGVRPIKLEAVPGFADLRETNLFGGPMLATPLRHPPLERAQRSPIHVARHVGWSGLSGHQMFKEGFCLQLRCSFQPDCRLPFFSSWIYFLAVFGSTSAFIAACASTPLALYSFMSRWYWRSEMSMGRRKGPILPFALANGSYKSPVKNREV
jgi:hypothetical protein